MDLQQCKELVTVVECGSLTAAADKMGYTLSGISKSISSLEKELGLQLLYRSKKGITPTKECESLLPYVNDILKSVNNFNQKASMIRGVYEGEITIGTAYRYFYKWLSKVTSEFHEQHNGVYFKIYNGTSTDFIEQLEKHSIDFCLISERKGEHDWYPIFTDSLVALLPVKHKLSKRKRIPIEVFEKEPYVSTCPGLDIDSGRFFNKYNINPNTQFSSMDIQATYAMVDAGMGISITNRINSLTGYEGICHREIYPTENIEIGLACERNLSPACQAFLQFMLTRLSELKESEIV